MMNSDGISGGEFRGSVGLFRIRMMNSDGISDDEFRGIDPKPDFSREGERWDGERWASISTRVFGKLGPAF